MCIACYCIYCRKVFVTQESNIPFLTLSCVNILVLHGYQFKHPQSFLDIKVIQSGRR